MTEPFDRRILAGHLTGSAVVISAAGDRVLLLHHRKLDRWLQPGGHGDPGEVSGEAVALREALEETGLAGPGPASHGAPARSTWTSTTSPPAATSPRTSTSTFGISWWRPPDAEIARCLEETNDLRWFSWDELDALGLDAGLRRLLEKARHWAWKARDVEATGSHAGGLWSRGRTDRRMQRSVCLRGFRGSRPIGRAR